VSKVLKGLLHSGLLVSHRGTKGGYSLAREPGEITLTDIISAIEGPIALTECSSDISGLCELEPCCAIKINQQIISRAVRGVLDKLTLSDLLQPLMLTAVRNTRGDLVPTISVSPGRMQ
jgi:Rrf2 family protein